MKTFEEQLNEVKRFYPNVAVIPEGGVSFIFFQELELPSGCIPGSIDALLCPVMRDGYHSRLFYAQKIEGIPQKNWNGTLRICDKTWYSYSWNSKEGMDLIQMIQYHLYTLSLAK
ncbi:MAG: hypothetical protein ABR974_05040 [Bacteroidales bacterium]|jgi:hypothetical protein